MQSLPNDKKKLSTFFSCVQYFLQLFVIIFSFLVIFSTHLCAQHQFIEENERLIEREKWWFYQRSYPFDSIPFQHIQRQAEQIQSDKILSRSALPEVQTYSWALLGPTNIAGRMPGVAVHPTQTAKWLAGSAGGGLWISNTAGASWNPVSRTNFPVYAIGSLKYNPHNPSIIFAGTGEPNFAYNNYPGYGIIRSTDGGNTWNRFGQATLSGSIADIEFHGTDTNLVFAACAGFGWPAGIYRSANRGQTWERTLSGGIGMDVLPHPYEREIIFAALSNPFGGTANGVYRSIDTGKTWIRLYNGLPTEHGRVKLAISRQTPQPRLFAFISNINGGLQGLYYSDDNGTNWQNIITTPQDVFGGAAEGQGWYDIAIAVSPTNPEEIFIGGVWLYRTINSGGTWQKIQDIHVDIHSIHFITSDSILVGHDGGINIVRTQNVVAQSIEKNQNLSTTQLYDFDVNFQANRIIGGTQDQGGLSYSGSLWSQTIGGDIMQTYISQQLPNVQVAVGPYGFVYKTSNSGQQWFSSVTGLDFSEPFAWVSPLAFFRGSSNDLLYVASSKVYRSVDLANTWQAFSPNLAGANIGITAIGTLPANANHVVVGAANGKVFRTTNAGFSWDTLSQTLPNKYITSVNFVGDQNTIVVTQSGYGTPHAWLSTNGGINWQNISSNLPDVPANDFLAITGRWFIGTDFGPYVSYNSGQTWLPITNGIGISPITKLIYNSTSNELYISTYGMGVWSVNSNALPVELAYFNAQYKDGQVQIEWETSSEKQCSYFSVYRQMNNEKILLKNFPCSYNSTIEKLYQFNDIISPIFIPKNQEIAVEYILTQTDADGSTREVSRKILRLQEQNAHFSSIFFSPNPVERDATISYQLDETQRVSVAIFSLQGVLIKTLMDNVLHNSGNFGLHWDGNNQFEQPVADGAYIARVHIGNELKNIVFIKKQ